MQTKKDVKSSYVSCSAVVRGPENHRVFGQGASNADHARVQ
jgi:hypothetical protein